MLSSSRSHAREESASEVAARAAEAAVRAADAALVAANAAIRAANAAVRLVDEHDHKVIVLEPSMPPRRGEIEAPKVIHLPSSSDLSGQALAPSVSAAAAHDAAVRRLQRLKRLALRSLAPVLIMGGTLLLLDATVTLTWQEPLSALYATLRQDHLSSALQREERALPAPAERSALATLEQRARIAYLARALKRRARSGTPVARIRIPRIGASFVVVDGTSTSALRSGPGIYPETVFPGIPGTTAIAGHRTTYLAPFRHIDALHRGNRIVLKMPYGDFTYRVIGKRVVQPSNVRAAVANVGYSRLVLSACTPLFSAAKRLLVFARLTTTVAVGAGRLPAPSLASRPVSEAARTRV
jgi:sortase A